jgi:MarR family transcriptional regulator, lower aerobic nicotinate degradation pathway regulator
MARGFELYRAPGHLIRRLQQIAVALFMQEARGFDLTPVQYAALLMLRDNPGLDQGRLGQLIAIDRSTAANVVARLEGKGLVRRRPGARDRRTKPLFITPAGRRLAARATPAVAGAQELILAPLKPAERAVFMAQLARLVHINNDRSRAPLRLNGEAQRPDDGP